jgi:SAM-dependent methyltransferase
MTDIAFEPGSFRDRTSRVFYHADGVFRALNSQASQEWRKLSSTAFFQRFVNEGKLIHTEQIETSIGSALIPEAGWETVLKHQTIPFVSYPYEWCFGMLKDAALLQLELLQAALAEDMTLKDASPFNVQWIGTHPVFIDIPSFERLVAGEPWVGYRQFCQLFFYPLLLQAYKDMPFQPWLRGNLEGIEAAQCARLLSVRDRFRPGVLAHVYLQAKAQAAYAQTARDLKSELRQVGFHKALIQANVSRLQKTIQNLTWHRSRSAWSEYEHHAPYLNTDREQKVAFVRRVVQTHPWRLVWDLGCNTGTFACLAAENARSVVAMDIDPLVIERLYQTLKIENNNKILPLVNNLADPSPNLGWRGQERRALTARGKPDLILCLALIHHVVIGAHVPLDEFLNWLASIGSSLVIEFVTRDDPMVRGLLRNKADHYNDYNLAYFEHHLAASYEIGAREPLSSGTRILYYGKVKTYE